MDDVFGIFSGVARKLLGAPPVGFEVLEYAFNGFFVIYMVKAFFSLIYMPFKFFKQRKGVF